MDNLLKKLPMDIIKIILSYDKRFIIRKGYIITIDTIDLKKYNNINKLLFNNLLQKKSRPRMKNIRDMQGKKWQYYQIKLGINFIIYYHINYMQQFKDICFIMTKKIICDSSMDDYNIIAKIKIK
jgi:hypothetical protein